MQDSHLAQIIANDYHNDILAGYLRACKANREPSGRFLPSSGPLCSIVLIITKPILQFIAMRKSSLGEMQGIGT